MKKKIHILLIVFFVIFINNIISQNEEDLLRYSNTDLQGTARYASMGGAFGALGADISVLSVNPAGMGRYKTGTITSTINLNIGSTSVSLNNKETIKKSENLDFNNLGIIGVHKTSSQNPSLWRKIQFGFVYNRLSEFNDRYIIEGKNNASFSYVLANRGYGREPDNIYVYDKHYSSLAYENYLIDYVVDSNEKYYTTQMHDLHQKGISHKHSVETKGRLGESALSVSGNYADKIYVGLTLGIDKIRYNRTKTHFESSNSDSLAIDNFTFIENLSTRGNGLNIKIGTIILPTSWLRIGLAIHTPTRFNYMRDTWNSEITTNFKDGRSFDKKSISSSYVYKMRTPGRIIGSLSFVSKKVGILSLDCEYINYGKALLRNHINSGDSYDFKYENTITNKIYKSAFNIRIGGEYRVSKFIMARLGYAINGGVYNNKYKEQYTPKSKYSAGLGFRTNNISIDLAVIHSNKKENYYMYDPQIVENTFQTKKSNSILLSIGIRI